MIVMARHVMMLMRVFMDIAMMTMAAALLARGVGLGVEPGLGIERLGLGIIEAAVEEPCRGGFAAMGGEDARRRIEGPEPADQRMERILALAPGEEVELGEHQPVGDRRLLHRFGMGIERRFARNAIDDGDDAFEPAAGEE